MLPEARSLEVLDKFFKRPTRITLSREDDYVILLGCERYRKRKRASYRLSDREPPPKGSNA
jgi:hypothetical protein